MSEWSWIIVVGLTVWILFKFRDFFTGSPNIEDVRSQAVRAADAARAARENEQLADEAAGRRDAERDLEAWLKALARAARKGDTSLYFSENADRHLIVPGRPARAFFKSTHSYKREYVNRLANLLGQPFKVAFNNTGEYDRWDRMTDSYWSFSIRWKE